MRHPVQRHPLHHHVLLFDALQVEVDLGEVLPRYTKDCSSENPMELWNRASRSRRPGPQPHLLPQLPLGRHRRVFARHIAFAGGDLQHLGVDGGAELAHHHHLERRR